MTLELANRYVTYPMGIAKDVIIIVDKFNFLADFVIVDFEADPRVPIILGKPFLRTAKALVDLYEEKLTLRIGNEELVFRAENFTVNSPSRECHSIHSINIIDSPCEEISNQNESDSHLEEFADELAHIISPLEYDCFYFDIEPDLGELTLLFEGNMFKDSTKELTSHELNNFLLILSDCDFTFSEEFSKIDLLVLFPPGNKDKVFDPGIFTINGVHSKRFFILLLDDFSSTLFVRYFLFLTDPSEIETLLSLPAENEDKVFDPGILLNDGIFSFPRKSPHLLIDNFMIDKCHILSEISLKIESSVSFLPKDKEIRGYSKLVETAKKAFEVYISMQRLDFKPNMSTFASIIGACSLLSAFEVGQQVQGQLMKTEFASNIKMESALVDMYAKCGRIEDARAVFNGMKVKNVFSWTSMIDGYGKNGDPNEALALFGRMQNMYHVRPNHVTFLGALSACGHAGLERLNEGFSFVMYNALKKPNSDVWAALLSSCRLHGDVEMASIAANELFKLSRDSRPGAYVALSNALADAGRWDRVSDIRELMKTRNISKNSGSSWIGTDDGLECLHAA
ncbi:pentatricopeptide repeat-containing protein [Tanacetum coccineum]|uniref:Pentatricopeptide repeat-containing protein n=1 Tax=Tanacetum coccineum TaxID=301880 RepID=A0ABQ4YK75_9ASTR